MMKEVKLRCSMVIVYHIVINITHCVIKVNQLKVR